MKKLYGLYFRMISLLAGVFAVFSCTVRTEAPAPEHSAYIKAYTGGQITEGGAIRIEFTAIPPASGEMDAALFAFRPALKGTVRWTAPDAVEFHPEPGALKEGRTYRAALRLDRIYGKDLDKRVRKFPFSFRVAGKEGCLELTETVIPADAPGTVRFRLRLTLSTPAEPQVIEKALRLSGTDASGEIRVKGAAGSVMDIEIDGIPRSGKDRSIQVGLADGYRARELSCLVPGTEEGGLRLVRAEHFEGSDPSVLLCFSEPLSESQDRAGLCTIDGVGRAWMDAQDNQIHIHYDKATGETVQLTVSEALRDRDGHALASAVQYAFRPEAAKPAVQMELNGCILPGKDLLLPFRAVGLAAVDLKVVKIYESNVLMHLQNHALGENATSELRRSGRLVLKKHIRLDGDPTRNLQRWNDYAVDLGGIIKEEPGALYRILLSFRKEYSVYGQAAAQTASPLRTLVTETLTEEEKAAWDNPVPYWYEESDWSRYNWSERNDPTKDSYYIDYDYPSCVVTASRIGLMAQSAGNGRTWITATDLRSAAPEAGVDVELYNYQLRRLAAGKTDGEGHVTFNTDGKPFLAVGRKGKSVSYLRLTSEEENPTSRFDVGGVVLEKGLKGYLYGERGVWRPGDTLHLSLIVRDQTHRLPEAHPATAELFTPEGQFHSRQVCPKGENGFYTFALATSADDPTGLWNAYVHIGGCTLHKGLRIETVKPNRLKIHMDFGENMLHGGSTAPLSVRAAWLTGPAAGGLAVKTDMTLRSAGSRFKGYDGYVFRNPAASFPAAESRLLSSRLDAAGTLQAPVTLPAAKDAPGMLTADLVCTVEENGGDASFTVLSMPFSPFSSYVGIRLPESAETDTDCSFPVVTVRPDGSKTAGDRLEYRIYKLKWSWWWENRSSELDSYVQGQASEPVASGTLTSGAADAAVRFRVNYPEWGRYLVYVKDLSSGHATGGVVDIDWPSWRGRADKKDPDALTILSFSLDKKSCAPGETVCAYLPAAPKGRALISIENSTGVLFSEWVKTDAEKETPFRFKVTKDMVPGCYVHVTLLQPHGQSGNDLPIRLYGIQPLQVEDPASVLTPVIGVPKTILPEEPFTVTVKEKNGRPMTYTLAIVDEGLLDLTNFKTPDPKSFMFAKEALGVRTWDLYDEVIGAFGGKMPNLLGIGGDQDILVKPKKENRFKPVVKFLGPFTLKNGTARHAIRLPMYIGSVRTMVVAGNDGAYGSAEQTLTVKAPLMVVPSLPRAAAPDEEIVLPVNVFALDGAVRDVSVRIKTDGALQVAGESVRTLRFSEEGDQMVRFALKTTGEGTGSVTVEAVSKGYTASETISLPVRPVQAARLESALAEIPAGSGKTLSYGTFTEDERNWSRLELTGFPSINAAALYTFASDYAYDCTEQLSARGLILTSLKPLLSEKEKAGADKQIPAILQSLYGRQKGDGGFSYWPSINRSDEWVTSMAGHFMLTGSQNGLEVDKGVLAKWMKFQKNAVQAYRRTPSLMLGDLAQAYRLYTLALAGSADAGAMNRLKEDGELTTQARWMLAAAYAAAGKQRTAEQLLENIPSESEDYHEYHTYGSETRDLALMSLTRLACGDLSAATQLLQKVALRLEDRGYSTQEAAFAALAAGQLAKKTGNGALSTSIRPDGGKEQKLQSDASSLRTELPGGSGSVSVQNTGGATLFARITSSRTPKAGENIAAVSHGLTLQVSYTDLDGNPVQTASLVQGTEMRCVIRLGNPGAETVRQVALTQIIPSGWEIVNERMTRGAGIDSYQHQDIRDDRSIWYVDVPKGAVKTFRLRLRAAYEGVFRLPAIQAEAMYEPDLYASTAGGTVKVTRP